MAEQSLTVKLVGDTASGVENIRKFSQALHDSVTAADGAGGAVKTLGKITSETKREQILATEATQRAALQQKALNDAVNTFGPKSKEAAAAAKRFNAAQDAANKATATAVASMNKLADATHAAAKAEEGNLQPATKRALAALDSMGKTAERTAFDLQRIEVASVAASKGTSKLSSGISALTVAGGALLAGGISRVVSGIGDSLASSVKSSIEFESSMTAVSKVLDDQSPENLKLIDSQIKELAESLGVMPNEIAQMTQALAASGLQGDLKGYTEDAAKLGVAFDLTGQEAGHAIASLTASLGLSRGEMQSLMGTINELDDGMNSSSKQLVTYLEGVAGIGRAASISGETMLALGSAIISTGTAPDVAATGVKNFIATMESGSAATDAQVAAFTKLGFKAEEVAKQMATGNAEAEIKKISAAIAGLPPEERFSTLIDLFGKESIGSVGGLATGVDLLGQAFEIAGDKAAAAGSVQAEYERVSQTTAHSLEKLKATLSVAALAIGDELLPEINILAKDLAAWVSENKELIKTDVISFIHGTVDAMKGLAKILGAGYDAFQSLSSAVGGADKALAAIGVTALALTGPFGAAAAAGAAIGYGMAEAYDWAARKILGDTAKIGAKMQALLNEAADIRHKEHEAEMSAIKAEMDADQAYQDQHTSNMAKAEALAQRYEAAELARLGKRATEEEKLAAFRKSRQLASAVNGDSRLLGGGTEEDRLANFEKYVGDKEGPAASKRQKSGKSSSKSSKSAESEDRKANAFARDLMDFDFEVAQFTAKMSKKIREDDIASQQAAFDAQADLFDKNAVQFDRELELLEARGLSEEDAQVKREELMDRRLEAEQKLANEQMRLAKTDAQREIAQTKLEDIEHKKRIVQTKRAAAEEAKVSEKKAALADKLSGAMTTVSGALIDAAWAAAEGEKGAGLQSLADFAKVQAQKFTLIGVGELAQAAVMAAGVVTAPLAAGHLIAAGQAFGVAALAGGAAIGLGAAAKSAKASATPAEEKDPASSPFETHGNTDPGDSSHGSGKGGGGSGGDVPVSYYDGGGASKPQQSSQGDSYHFTIQGGTFFGTNAEKTAQEFRKIMEQGKGAGKR